MPMRLRVIPAGTGRNRSSCRLDSTFDKTMGFSIGSRSAAQTRARARRNSSRPRRGGSASSRSRADCPTIPGRPTRSRRSVASASCVLASRRRERSCPQHRAWRQPSPPIGGMRRGSTPGSESPRRSSGGGFLPPVRRMWTLVNHPHRSSPKSSGSGFVNPPQCPTKGQVYTTYNSLRRP